MRQVRTDRHAFRTGASFREAWAATMERWAGRRERCRMPGHRGCRHAPREPRLDKIGVA
jgi:hypothetical protein